MIKQLLNPVISKYCDLSVSGRSIISLSLGLQQIIDLLSTDKSQCFPQLPPKIANCTYSPSVQKRSRLPESKHM